MEGFDPRFHSLAYANAALNYFPSDGHLGPQQPGPVPLGSGDLIVNAGCERGNVPSVSPGFPQRQLPGKAFRKKNALCERKER